MATCRWGKSFYERESKEIDLEKKSMKSVIAPYLQCEK